MLLCVFVINELGKHAGISFLKLGLRIGLWFALKKSSFLCLRTPDACFVFNMSRSHQQSVNSLSTVCQPFTKYRPNGSSNTSWFAVACHAWGGVLLDFFHAVPSCLPLRILAA